MNPKNLEIGKVYYFPHPMAADGRTIVGSYVVYERKRAPSWFVGLCSACIGESDTVWFFKLCGYDHKFPARKTWISELMEVEGYLQEYFALFEAVSKSRHS